MKKILTIVCIMAVAMSITACSIFTCDLCGKEKSGKKYEGSFGTEICKDCHDDLEKLEKDIEKAFN